MLSEVSIMAKLPGLSPFSRIPGLTRSKTLELWEKRNAEAHMKKLKEEREKPKPQKVVPDIRLKDE